MTIVTRQEFRSLESEKIGQYQWYIKGASLSQEVALYDRIVRDLTEDLTSKKMWQHKIDILKGLDRIELNWL